MRIRSRIDQLERAAKAAGVGMCKLCWGGPTVLLRQEILIGADHESPATIDPLSRNFVTADGKRCIRCGTPVQRAIVFERIGLNHKGADPEGDITAEETL
ncbi:MAG: hypothetical protein WCI73_02530 [Phycisphaerae bacterium]